MNKQVDQDTEAHLESVNDQPIIDPQHIEPEPEQTVPMADFIEASKVLEELRNRVYEQHSADPDTSEQPEDVS